MTSLSPIDQAFFLLETPERPMNVGVLFVLPSTGSTPVRFADHLVSRMLECPVGPPFNARLRPGPFRPLLSLETDEEMDASRQVHRHRLPRGSDLDRLFRTICAIHVRLLPREEPLWQMHVFTGLPEGRVALYFKTHHGLIDGIGFIRVVTGMVTTSKAAGEPRAIWEGLRAGPTAKSARRSVAASGDAISVEGLFGLAREAGTALGDLARIVYSQSQRSLGRGHGLAVPFIRTPNVLRTAPSPHRVLAHCTFPLARARAIARRGKGKINDVMLAAVDVALSRYLEERGTPPDAPLVADIPVALVDHGGAGNRITILQVPMGKPGSAAKDRLDEIIRETREMKLQVRAVSASSLALYSILGHTAASTFESLGLEQSPLLANVVISNPAGLDRRVYFNGAPVELALPISVVGHQQVLNVTVTTYVGQLHVTLMAQREAIPDVRKLAGYVGEAVDRLYAELPAPGRARKPRRAQ
ncbi:MAG: WS/DGAT domain-containing protein [Steroidobacteraceae bacterium]|nr:WS/DGAT domain-containing protein [Steroidobacteraceae bacterium]